MTPAQVREDYLRMAAPIPLTFQCDEISSPVLHVVRHLPVVLRNIAPERAVATEEMCQGLRLHVTNGGCWEFEYDPATKTVELSRKTIEILWCCAHAYFTLYTNVLNQRRGPGQVDLRVDPLVAASMRALQWAFEDWVNGEDRPWPAGTPRPLRAPPRESAEHLADELCLCALAFILFHEVFHHSLQHLHREDAALARAQEAEADSRAGAWLLSDLDQADSRFIKRSLGTAVALLALAGFGIHTGEHGGETHPHHLERLLCVLGDHVRDGDHVVWAFVAGMLKLHLDNGGVPTPDITYPSFRSCAVRYAALFGVGPALGTGEEAISRP